MSRACQAGIKLLGPSKSITPEARSYKAGRLMASGLLMFCSSPRYPPKIARVRHAVKNLFWFPFFLREPITTGHIFLFYRGLHQKAPGASPSPSGSSAAAMAEDRLDRLFDASRRGDAQEAGCGLRAAGTGARLAKGTPPSVLDLWTVDFKFLDLKKAGLWTLDFFGL